MDRRKLKSSFRLARSQSLQRSVSINKVSASTIEETFWFGSVEQKIRTEWQKVWIRLNKRSILSYKEEDQDPMQPSIAFNLQTFGVYLEFHDASHHHTILENHLHEKDNKKHLLSDGEESNETDVDGNESVIDATNKDKSDNVPIENSFTSDFDENGEVDGIKDNLSFENETKLSECKKPFHGGYFVMILSNGLSNVAFKFESTSFDTHPKDVVNSIKGLQKAGIIVYRGKRFEIDDFKSESLLDLLKTLPEAQSFNGSLSHVPSAENLQTLEELDDEEGLSVVPIEVTKGGSLNRRLLIPKSSSPQIGNKIGLKFGKNKRKYLHERSLSLPPLVNRNENSNTSAVPINKQNIDNRKLDEEYDTKSNEASVEGATLIEDKDGDSQLAIEIKGDLSKEKHSDSDHSECNIIEDSKSGEEHYVKSEFEKESISSPKELKHIITSEEINLENSFSYEEEKNYTVSHFQSAKSDVDISSSTLDEIIISDEKTSEEITLPKVEDNLVVFENTDQANIFVPAKDSNDLNDKSLNNANVENDNDAEPNFENISTDGSEVLNENAANEDVKTPIFSKENDLDLDVLNSNPDTSNKSIDDINCEENEARIDKIQNNQIDEKLETKISDIFVSNSQDHSILVECGEDKELNFDSQKSGKEKIEKSQSSENNGITSKDSAGIEEPKEVSDNFADKVSLNKFTSKLHALSLPSISLSQNSDKTSNNISGKKEQSSPIKQTTESNKSPPLSTSRSFGRLTSVLSSKSIESETNSPPIKSSKSFGRLANLKSLGARWKNQVVGGTDESNVIHDKKSSSDDNSLSAINREVIRSQDRIVESISFFENYFEIDTPFEVQKKEFIPKAIVSEELYESKERELEAPNGSSESVNHVNESNSLPLFETTKEETLDQNFTSSFEIITNLCDKKVDAEELFLSEGQLGDSKDIQNETEINSISSSSNPDLVAEFSIDTGESPEEVTQDDSLKQEDDKTECSNIIDITSSNNIQEQITSDTFSYHRNYESDLENYVRQDELQKSSDCKYSEEDEEFENVNEFETTDKESFRDDKIETFSNCSENSESSSVSNPQEYSCEESDNKENNVLNISALYKDTHINNINNNTFLNEPPLEESKDTYLDSKTSEKSFNSKSDYSVSDSESNNSSHSKIWPLPEQIEEGSNSGIKKRRSYSSGSSDSDVIIIERKKNIDKVENRDTFSENLDSFDPSKTKTSSDDYESWPPDVIIDDEDNHVLPINALETDNVHEEKSDLTKSEDSNSSTKSTESSADPFKSESLPDLFSNIETDPFSTEDPFYEEDNSNCLATDVLTVGNPEDSSSSHKRGFSDDFRNIFAEKDRILEESEEEDFTTKPSETISPSNSENSDDERKVSTKTVESLQNSKSFTESLEEEILIQRTQPSLKCDVEVEYEVLRKELSSSKTRKIATAFLSRFLKRPPANLKHSISVPAGAAQTDTSNKNNSNEYGGINVTGSELSIPKPIDTTLTEIKFDNKTNTLEVYEENNDLLQCPHHFKNELHQTSNLIEDKGPFQDALSDKDTNSLELIETKQDIDEIIETVKKEIEIYASKLSTDDKEYHSQYHVHLVDHTPLKRTFVSSKGKSLKIVNSDLDSSSDDDVIDIIRHQTPNNKQIRISKDNNSSQGEQISSAKTALEENGSLGTDKTITEYEQNIPDKVFALSQEGGENSCENEEDLNDISRSSSQNQELNVELDRFVDNQVHFELYSSSSSEEEEENKIESNPVKLIENKDSGSNEHIEPIIDEFDKETQVNVQEIEAVDNNFDLTKELSDSSKESLNNEVILEELTKDEANLNNHEEDENVNEIHSSELPQPVNTSREILPIQTKESVLNFETLKTFNVESPILIVKHKKLGNKKARKVLKRINVISKLKKKSKKQTKILEEGVLDDHQAIPSIHVESLRSRRSSLDSQNIENQKIIAENNITDTLTNKEGNKSINYRIIKDSSEDEEDVFYDFETDSISSTGSHENTIKVSYDPSINIDNQRNDLQQLVPLKTEFYVEFKSKSDIEIHHPIDHNIKKKDLSEYRKEVERWNSINKQPLTKALKKSNSEADLLKIIPTSSSFNYSLYSQAIDNRSSQAINQENSTNSLIREASSLVADSDRQDTTKNLQFSDIKKKKKKRGLISSLKRPLKRFNSNKISPPLPPTPISNNKSSQAPQWKPIDSTESINSKKLFRKSNSLWSLNSTNYNSNSSIQSVSGGSTFSLNKLIHRKKLKKLGKSQRIATSNSTSHIPEENHLQTCKSLPDIQESSQVEVSSLNTVSDADSILYHRDLPNDSSLDKQQHFIEPSINEKDQNQSNPDLINDSEISNQSQNNESLVQFKEITAESFGCDNQDQHQDQKEVSIPHILINSLEVIDEEDTQRTSSESEDNKSLRAESSQSSIDSFIKEVCNQEESSDTENSRSSEEKVDIERVLNTHISNKNTEKFLEEEDDVGSSSDESFYSFESDENIEERKVSFGSIRSLLHHKSYDSLSDRLNNNTEYFDRNQGTENSPQQIVKVEDNELDISYLGSNVKDIRKYSVTSESELPVTSSSDSETASALIPGKVGRRKLSSRKKKTSAQGNTEPHHSDSSDISYTDIFKDLFTKDSPYNEQQPNGKVTMASNYSVNTKSRSRSSSPFKKIKRFFRPHSRPSSSHRNERKDSQDLGQMTETSYYHVGSQRLYPPHSQDDNLNGRSIADQSQFDDNSYKKSVDQYSIENYGDTSQLNPNPLYRSDDEIPEDGVEIDKRYQSETTSVTSGRLLRASEVEDLSKFEDEHGIVSINVNDTIETGEISQIEPFIRPVTEDGRQLHWPRTVLKRPHIKSTSFRNSEPSTTGHDDVGLMHYDTKSEAESNLVGVEGYYKFATYIENNPVSTSELRKLTTATHLRSKREGEDKSSSYSSASENNSPSKNVVEIHNVEDEDANTAMLSFHEEYESEDGLGNTRYKKVLNEVEKSTHKFGNNLKASGMKEMDSYAEDSDSDKTRVYSIETGEHEIRKTMGQDNTSALYDADQNQDNSLNSTQKIGDINENVQENDPSDKYAYFSSPHKHDKEETSKNADVSSIIKNMTNIMSTTITKSETKDSVKVDDIETVQRVKNSRSSTSEEDQIAAQKQINGSDRSHEGKRIPPPKNVQPLIGGLVNVSLTPDGRWRRRYLALYPISEENSETHGIDTSTMKDINRPQILIFPRQSAKVATARIRLTSSHGIQFNGITIFGTDSEEKIKNLVGSKNDIETKDNEFTFRLVKRDKVTIYLKADTELEFRGWIDSLMHEIKRLIAEKEKCFALNQKTISSNGTNLASFHVTDQSRFVTELDTFNPVSDNTHNSGAVVQPHNNEVICSKEEDEESNLSIANSSILSLQTIKSKSGRSENQVQPHLYNQIAVRKKAISDDNELISSPTHHQRNSTESLPEHDAQILFALGKEEKVKRYSLYDKWTKKDNTNSSSAIVEEDPNSKKDSGKKEIKEEDNKKSWESNKPPSVNSTKEIKLRSEEVEKGNGESFRSVDINNLPDRYRTHEDKTHTDLAPVPSPRLNRISKLVTNKEKPSDKCIHLESEESTPINSFSQVSRNVYPLPKPRPRPRSFRTANITDNTKDKFSIDKEEIALKAYKEKHHIDTAVTTSSEIIRIEEHNITSGHFVNFDKLVERNLPKVSALKQSDFTIANIDYTKSGENEKSNSRKEFTIDQEYRVDHGYKEKSYLDVNRPSQAYSVEPHDVKIGVAEKVYSDRYFPTSSKEIVIVKEIDLKPLVVTQPKITYSQKDVRGKNKFDKEEAYAQYPLTERSDSKSGIESVDHSINPDFKSSPESHYRKQVEHFLYQKEPDISDFEVAVDVDEDSPPLIRGYCTPVDVDEEYNLPIGYEKTSKPIAVDSAIANTVWDTIIEEEEEEFEEELHNPGYLKRTESPSQDRRSDDVKSPQLVLNILRSKTEYPNIEEDCSTKPILSYPSDKHSSLHANKDSVNAKNPKTSKIFSARSNSSSVEDEKKKKIHDLLRKRLGEATSLSHSSISRSESCTNPDNSLVQNTFENVVENANETGEVSDKPFNPKQTKSVIDVPRKAKMIIPKSTEEFEDPGVSDQSWRVRNMSSYWEYQIHTIEDENGDGNNKHGNPRKVSETARQERKEIWKSLPDLSSSSSSSSSSTSDHSDTEEKNHIDDAKEDKDKSDKKKRQTSYVNPSYDPKQLYNSEDDAQVCSIVPIKDRKVIFEQIQNENVQTKDDEKNRGGKLKAPENSDSVDEDDIVCKQRTGVRSQAREATISPPPVWSDHLIHHQKRQSQLRSNWPSMPSLNVRIRHEGKQPMALVGANFPDMKAPGEAGEITNTPVKDLLEQFKVDEESSQKDAFSEKGSVNSKYSSSIAKDYPKKDELDAANNKVASSIKLFDNGSDEIDHKNQGRIVNSTKFDLESIVTSDSDLLPIDKTMAIPPPSARPNNCLHQQNNQEKPKIVSAYRWEDESNGEIYTDMPLDQGEEMKHLPLYVVENGQEFPLLPLSQRKTSFEFVPRLPSKSYTAPLIPSDENLSTRPSTLSIVPSTSTRELESKVPRTESFTVSRSENQNFLPDGKVELESTVQMTLQQKSILHESDLNRRSAATSVSASGLQTPKVSSFVYHDNDRISQCEDNAGVPEDSFEFPAPPMPLEEGEFENDARSEGNLSDKEVVKSEEAPYIVQEKDILSNIRVVDEVKRKFSGQY